MSTRRGTWIIGILMLLGAIHLAKAAVTVDGYFRLGENDPGAAAGAPGKNPTLDTTLTKALTIGAGVPINVTVTDSTAIQRTGSTLAMSFDGASRYITNAPLSAVTDNYGIEAWFRPASLTGSQILTANGGGFGAYALWLNTGVIYGYKDNVGQLSSSVKATLGRWCHTAFVVTNGVGCLYVNGALCVTGSLASAYVPATSFAIGSFTAAGSFPYNGAMDEVRVFHFAPGAFRATDLLYYAPLPAQSYYTGTVLADNPVASFRLNEAEGPGMFDLVSALQQKPVVGFYNKGTFIAPYHSNHALITMDGPRPGAFRGLDAGNTAPYFNGGAATDADGDTSVVTLPGAVGTDYSIEYFFRSSDLTGYRYIVGRGTSAGYDVFGTEAPGRLFGFNNTQQLNGTAPLTANTWYHVVVVRSGTTVTMYLNGVFEASTTMAATAGTSNRFILGRRPSDGNSPFKGYVDEVSIYDHALTADQVLAHYNMAILGPPVGSIIAIR